jgi:2-polyprenyl-6-methoxyphenol hydroxylase-like FAD-dependent oxidoreductase
MKSNLTDSRNFEVVIVGGGIAGLTLALCLNQKGISCRIYEATAEWRPLGVGISLLPHGTKELSALGLLDDIRAVAVEFRDSCFYTRFGQFVYRDVPDNQWPQFLIHRAALHEVLYGAVCQRLGPEAVSLGCTCVGVEQDANGAVAKFRNSRTGEPIAPQHGDVVVACDGIHSAVRAQFYPSEKGPVFSGVNMWRGVTRHAPILSGGTHARIGTVDPAKMVIYPIRNNVDAAGNQLFNWVAEVRSTNNIPVDWNRPGRLEDVVPYFRQWRFEWLDVVELIERAEAIYEFPMSDRDPISRWVFDRVALVGDAAHPMLPRGSNGAMQAILDARVLADSLSTVADPVAALKAYELARLQRANAIVLANRSTPPDFLIEEVSRRTGDRPFGRLDDFISQNELRGLLEKYKSLAGYSLQALANQPGN